MASTAAEVTCIQEPVAVVDQATMVLLLRKGLSQSITTMRAATDLIPPLPWCVDSAGFHWKMLINFMYNSDQCYFNVFFFNLRFIAGICLMVQLATFALLLGYETTTLILPTNCCELAALGCDAGSPVAVADQATMVMALGKGWAIQPVVHSTTPSIMTMRAATD